jgi:hypothetical protein
LNAKIRRFIGSSGSLVRSNSTRAAGSRGGVAQVAIEARMSVSAAACSALPAILVMIYTLSQSPSHSPGSRPHSARVSDLTLPENG